MSGIPASAAKALSLAMSRVTNALAFFSGSLVFLYVLLVAANIIGRNFFNRPIDGTVEIGQLVLAMVIFFNLAYAQLEKAHIRVTFLLEHLSSKYRRKMELAILAIGFFCMAIMTWRSIPFALSSFYEGESHMSVDLPIWPTKFIFLIGWILLGLEFFSEFVNKILNGPDSHKIHNQELEK